VPLFGLGSTFDEAILASPCVSLGESKRYFLDLCRFARSERVERSRFRRNWPAAEKRALLPLLCL
jgi:hypothetical protein